MTRLKDPCGQNFVLLAAFMVSLSSVACSSAPPAEVSGRDVAAANVGSETSPALRGTESSSTLSSATGAEANAAERVTLCPAGQIVAQLEGEIRGDRLAVRADCGGTGQPEVTRPMSIPLHATRVDAPKPLLNLWRPDLVLSQSLLTPANGRYLEISLQAGVAPCPVVHATPVADPPMPTVYMDQNQRWDRSLGFYADRECSVLLIVIGNEAVVLERSRPSSARIFNLRLEMVRNNNS